MAYKPRRSFRHLLQKTASVAGASALLVGAIAPALPAHAQWPGANGSIIYQKNISTATTSVNEFYAINNDGSNNRKLSISFPKNAQNIYGMRFNREATKIVYSCSIGGVPRTFIANANGSGAVQVASYTSQSGAPYDYAWTSDSAGVFYSSPLDNKIHYTNAAGTEGKILDITLPTDFTGYGDPKLTPDNGYLAFSSYDTVNYSNDILIAPSGGGAAENVSNTTSTSETDYDWHPDNSNRILARSGGVYGTFTKGQSGFTPLSGESTSGYSFFSALGYSPSGDYMLAYGATQQFPNMGHIYMMTGSAILQVPNLTFDSNVGITGDVLGWTSANVKGSSVSLASAKLPDTGVVRKNYTNYALLAAIPALLGMTYLGRAAFKRSRR